MELRSYLALINALNKLDQTNSEVKTKIFDCLIHKIEITKDGCRIHFFTGEAEIERGLVSAGPALSFKAGNSGNTNLLCTDSISGSTVLTNGGDARIRTEDPFHAMEILYQLSYIPTIECKKTIK